MSLGEREGHGRDFYLEALLNLTPVTAWAFKRNTHTGLLLDPLSLLLISPFCFINLYWW